MDKTYIRNSPLQAPVLAISGSSSPDPKITNTVETKIDGNVYPGVTASTLTGFLTGITTILPGFVHAVAVLLSPDGNYSVQEANQQPAIVANGAPTFVPLAISSLLPGSVYPTGLLPVPKDGFATIGWIIIANTSTSVSFVGGTTDLDASDVFAFYVDNYGNSGN